MRRLICAAVALAMLSTGFVTGADVTEQQWVRASASGAVEGRVIVPRDGAIVAARKAKVTLIDQRGESVVAGIESDNTGRFALSGVKPGVYTLLIQGDKAFACCALHVVNSNVPISDQFEIAAGAVDYQVVRSAMVRYLPAGQTTRVEFDPTSNPLTSERAQLGEAVRIRQTEGGLKGRLTRAGFGEDLGAESANVLVYRDGVQVARTVTDGEGNFQIDELALGSYSILGSGKDGFGLLGIELVDPLVTRSAVDANAEDASAGETLVVQDAGAGETFVMQIGSGPITVIEDRLIDEREVGPAIPLDDGIVTYSGGSMGGGGGPSGGGIGGGLRLRGGGLLLGAAGLAVALADDDDVIILPPTASPSLPAVVPAP